MSSSASNPGIIYALVARGTCVLAEFTTTSGNFTTVTRRILEKLPQTSRMSYAYDGYIFHYVVVGGLTFLCMADEALAAGFAFVFFAGFLLPPCPAVSFKSVLGLPSSSKTGGSTRN